LTGANVTADIFTSGVSKRTEAVFALAASLLALSFALLLAWRMWDGMLDQRDYDYTTTILQFPHWVAFIPILTSLALLAVAALMTLKNAARGVKEG
jgi:TRAP-type C4-dicarboxylate transport system permease small subunit